MDRFSRNWYQNFANFSEMVISWSILVLHPHPRIHPRNHTFIDHASHIYGPIFSKLVSKFCKFFGDGDIVVFFSFTPPPTHPPTHSHIYLPIFSKFLSKFCKFFEYGDDGGFFKFYSPIHPPTHPRTHPRTHTFMDRFSRN